MVWGCFSYKGVGRLFIVPKGTTVNPQVYKTILEKRMLPSARDLYPDNEYIFQDDGAPCHRAKSVKSWLLENNIRTLENWPGQSPDVNPIENLWSLMKGVVQKRMPKSRTELIAAVIYAWNHVVKKETIEKLVDSLPNRLKAVIAAKGFATKY